MQIFISLVPPRAQQPSVFEAWSRFSLPAVKAEKAGYTGWLSANPMIAASAALV
jgi:hypothetical protein